MRTRRLAAEMGPGEYVWLYGLVYHGWLGHDAAAGRRPGRQGAGDKGAGDARFSLRREQWRAGVTPEAATVLEPLREQLVAGWNEETNPVELIFVADDRAGRRRAAVAARSRPDGGRLAGTARFVVGFGARGPAAGAARATASRSRNSICPLTLRRSASAQRRISRRGSGLSRSGNALRSSCHVYSVPC
ncbi:MAG: hypothetical protein IPH48_11215 [bacterium]|nr:hypothetical protein [bacterium]